MNSRPGSPDKSVSYLNINKEWVKKEYSRRWVPCHRRVTGYSENILRPDLPRLVDTHSRQGEVQPPLFVLVLETRSRPDRSWRKESTRKGKLVRWTLSPRVGTETDDNVSVRIVVDKPFRSRRPGPVRKQTRPFETYTSIVCAILTSLFQTDPIF